MTQLTFITLGPAALGSIEPHDTQQERLDDITERLLTDEFYVTTNETLPRKCIDGRSPAAGFSEFAPNAAGGSETLLIADELTEGRFHTASQDTAGDFHQLLTFLKENGHRVGGHGDDHAIAPASGCGANDKLPAIIQFMAEQSAVIRSAAEAIGVTVNDEAHARIIAKAQVFLDEDRFAAGAIVLETLRNDAGDAAIDKLTGAHNEVVAVINMKSQTTLDRNAVKREFGDTYQAFNVDAWSFAPAARVLGGAEEAVIAMVYYNLTTAYVLGGPGLRVVVRQ